MTEDCRLAPLPELVYRLRDTAPYGNLDGGTKRELHLIDAAYRAGADQELEACCEWLSDVWGLPAASDSLCAARRPKPPSLKEQALGALENLNGECLLEGFECPEKVAIIRRALESLPD